MAAIEEALAQFRSGKKTIEEELAEFRNVTPDPTPVLSIEEELSAFRDEKAIEDQARERAMKWDQAENFLRQQTTARGLIVPPRVDDIRNLMQKSFESEFDLLTRARNGVITPEELRRLDLEDEARLTGSTVEELEFFRARLRGVPTAEELIKEEVEKIRAETPLPLRIAALAEGALAGREPFQLSFATGKPLGEVQIRREAIRRIRESGKEFASVPQRREIDFGDLGAAEQRQRMNRIELGIITLGFSGFGKEFTRFTRDFIDDPISAVENHPTTIIESAIIFSPALRPLMATARAASAIRGLVSAKGLVGATQQLTMQAQAQLAKQAQRFGFTGGVGRLEIIGPLDELQRRVTLRMLADRDKLASAIKARRRLGIRVTKQRKGKKTVDLLADTYRQQPDKPGDLLLNIAKTTNESGDILFRPVIKPEVADKIYDSLANSLTRAGIGIPKDEAPFLFFTRKLATLPKEEAARLLSFVQDELQKLGLTHLDLAVLLSDTASVSGRTLGFLSKATAKLRALSPAADKLLGNLEIPFSPFEFSWYSLNRATDIWRGSLVTQLATAVRNFETGAVRLPLDVLEQGVDDVVRTMFRLNNVQDKGLANAFEGGMELIRSMSGGRFPFVGEAVTIKRVDEILGFFPKESERLFFRYSSDLLTASKSSPRLSGAFQKGADSIFNKSETMIRFANTFNIMQEFAVRKTAFRLRLAEILRRKGMNIDSINPRLLDPNDIADAINWSLEATFAAAPKSQFVREMVSAINKIPPLKLIAPFARFTANSLRYLNDYNPTGFLKLLTRGESERLALLKGEKLTLFKRLGLRASDKSRDISKAVIGTGFLLTAKQLRDSEFAGGKWYQLIIAGKTIDMRPFAPFSSYLFIADLYTKIRDRKRLPKTIAVDLAQGLLGANFRAGSGLFLLEKVAEVIDQVRQEGEPEPAANALLKAIGEPVGGLFTPFQTIKDFYSEFDRNEARIRDTRENPFLGPVLVRIPKLSQELPLKEFPLGTEARREAPFLRQATGIIFRTLTPAETERDKLGLLNRDLSPGTGIPELDNEINKRLRPALESRISTLIKSEGYKQSSEVLKRIMFMTAARTERKLARQQALAARPDLSLKQVIRRIPKDRLQLIRESGFSKREQDEAIESLSKPEVREIFDALMAPQQ